MMSPTAKTTTTITALAFFSNQALIAIIQVLNGIITSTNISNTSGHCNLTQ